MRALVRRGDTVSLVTDAPEPTPAPGEALVRPLRMCVSSRDAEVARSLTEFTGVMGHEFVGVVERIEPSDALSAERVKALKGSRVVGSPWIACGECAYCRRGLSSHCPDAEGLGLRGRDGCFAERFVVPARGLVAVPDSVDDDRAVFAWLLAGAIHTAQQVRVEGKPYITVLGDGRLGLLTAQVMARLNASVRVVGTHEDKLARCEKWGVKHRLVRDVGERADQDVVVDCTGTRDGFELALRYVRPRGVILMNSRLSHLTARGAPERPLDLRPIVEHEITVSGSRGGSVAEAIGFLRSDVVDVVSLITRRMRLDDGPAIVRALDEPGAIGVLVEP